MRLFNNNRKESMQFSLVFIFLQVTRNCLINVHYKSDEGYIIWLLTPNGAFLYRKMNLGYHSR